MDFSLLIWAVLLAQPPASGESSVAELVTRLGSPRFQDRERASHALEAKGREALGALRRARSATDPELRARAAALVERIESEIVVRPTTVTLDFENRALSEVVKVFSERSSIPTVLDPESAEMLGARHITLVSEQAVPFWPALDRLCDAGLLRAEYGPQEAPNGDIVVGVRLVDAAGIPRCPTWDQGPFRAKLVGLHYQRERRLDHAFGAPRAFEQFQAQMEVLGEPRLVLGQRGSVKLVEAVDDKGNSLLPAVATVVEDEEAGLLDHREFIGGVTLNLSLPLSYPREPGKKIVRLRGTVPLAVMSRKSNPLIIPLADSVGKTFEGDEFTLTVDALRNDPNEGDSSIELRVRPRDADATELMVGGELLEHQIEVADAQGHELPVFAQEIDSQGAESRLILRLVPGEGASVPRQIHFYGLIRAEADVSFDFKDVEMP